MDDEIQQMWDMGQYSSPVDRHELIGLNYCIEQVLTQPRHGPRNIGRLSSGIQSTLSALRLLKPGAVGVGVTLFRPIAPAFGITLGASASSGPSAVSLGRNYALHSSDIVDLCQIVGAIDTIPADGVLRSALRRFNFAYERSRPEDRIIDYWVGLEALFAPDDQREFKYRLRLRTAYYLCDDPDGREDVYQTLGTSYDVRSKIVHGGEVPRDVDEVAASTEEILRRTLRRITLEGRFNADQLDVAIARGVPEQQGENPHDPTE